MLIFVSGHHRRAVILVALFAPFSPLDSLGLNGAFLEASIYLLLQLTVGRKRIYSWLAKCQ
ncbi:hypothetical protein VoSk93_26070 [Vibrio owensii]